MAYNKTLLQTSLRKVNKRLFKEAIFLSYKDGITSVAPLGFSGDTIMLFGDEHGGENRGRKSVVSIRNYGNDAELLITDSKGHFLFYGRFHISTGVRFVLNQYWRIFRSVRKYIESDIPARPDWANLEIPKTAVPSEGFEMLRRYQWYESMKSRNHVHSN